MCDINNQHIVSVADRSLRWSLLRAQFYGVCRQSSISSVFSDHQSRLKFDLYSVKWVFKTEKIFCLTKYFIFDCYPDWKTLSIKKWTISALVLKISGFLWFSFSLLNLLTVVYFFVTFEKNINCLFSVLFNIELNRVPINISKPRLSTLAFITYMQNRHIFLSNNCKLFTKYKWINTIKNGHFQNKLLLWLESDGNWCWRYRNRTDHWICSVFWTHIFNNGRLDNSSGRTFNAWWVIEMRWISLRNNTTSSDNELFVS